jgi:hypothetical protein
MLEIKSKRTKFTKTFHTGKNRRMLLCSPYPLHIEKEGKFTEINLKPEKTANGYILETPYYKFELELFPFKISFNEQRVRSLDSPQTHLNSLVDRGIEIKDAFPNLDILIRLYPEAVSLFLKLKEGKYELNWKNQAEFQQVYNYDIPMTVKALHFGKQTEFVFPEKQIEGSHEFTKYTKSDFYEDLPCMEIYFHG